MKILNPKYLITSFFILLFILFFWNLDIFRNFAKKYLPSEVKIFVKSKIFGEKYLNEIKFFKISNYNQKTLPNTQFIKLNFKKEKMENFNAGVENYYNILNNQKAPLKKKFYIEVINDEIYLLDSTGLLIKINNFSSFKREKVKNNIKDLKSLDIKDLHFLDGDIFITYAFEVKKNCNVLKIAKANINNSSLVFKNFFTPKECNHNIIAGKMGTFEMNKKKGLIVTTGSDGMGEKKYAQLDDSIYGKILFFDLDTKNFKIISKGHRNPQGLYVYNNMILSTEHGPKGGDEINLIQSGKNYGWPVSSYGEPYSFEYKKKGKYEYFKNHSMNEFKEPVYSFVPSIGISQIIKIPKNFSPLWEDNFLVSSLNGRSLFRIKFDKNFEKVIYREKIIIGERIRDMVYLKKHNMILVALEDSGSLGLIKAE